MMTKDGTLPLFETRPGQRAFDDFDRANPQVWALFERFALEALRRRTGSRRIGARLVWERMRWFTQVETDDQAFKLNDHWTPFYARKFHQRHPEWGLAFEIRERNRR